MQISKHLNLGNCIVVLKIDKEFVNEESSNPSVDLLNNGKTESDSLELYSVIGDYRKKNTHTHDIIKGTNCIYYGCSSERKEENWLWSDKVWRQVWNYQFKVKLFISIFKSKELAIRSQLCFRLATTTFPNTSIYIQIDQIKIARYTWKKWIVQNMRLTTLLSNMSYILSSNWGEYICQEYWIIMEKTRNKKETR